MKRNKGFTLIELLTVIAIIAILAGILIPTVGIVRKNASIAASKTQLSNYVNAIQLFKSDYGYYPLVAGTEDSAEFRLSNDTNSELLIQTLSGRATDGTALSPEQAKVTGNRRREAYQTFTDDDYFRNSSGNLDRSRIADRFNNRDIVIVIDTDGDGFVDPNPEDDDSKPADRIRSPITAYVNADRAENAPGYTLWD